LRALCSVLLRIGNKDDFLRETTGFVIRLFGAEGRGVAEYTDGDKRYKYSVFAVMLLLVVVVLRALTAPTFSQFC
jgi:hypothetical protein